MITIAICESRARRWRWCIGRWTMGAIIAVTISCEWWYEMRTLFDVQLFARSNTQHNTLTYEHEARQHTLDIDEL